MSCRKKTNNDHMRYSFICLQTLVGLFVLSPASASIICSAGEYSYNDTTCVGCESGRYAPKALSDSCLSCGAGSYTNNDTRATECNSCPTGYDSKSESSSCNLAEVGYYLYPSKSSLLTSHACVKHATCLGGKATPLPHRGYWVDHSSLSHSYRVYTCLRATCKDALSVVNDSLCFDVNHYNDTALCSDIQCEEGSSGPLCGACLEEYIYEPTTKECIKCKNAKKYTYVVLIAIFLISTLAFLVIFLNKSKEKKKGAPPSPFMLDFINTFNFANFKVLWSTFQISQSVSYTLDIKFPFIFRYALKVMNFLSFNFLSVECFLSYWDKNEETSYYYSVYVWNALPLVLIGFFGILTLIRVKLQNSGSDFSNKKKNQLYQDYLWHVFYLMFLVLPPLVHKQLSVFDCFQLDHGISLLRQDTRISCDDKNYKFFRMVVFGCFVFYQLLLALCFCWLYGKCQMLNPQVGVGASFVNKKEEDDSDTALHIRSRHESLNTLSFLFVDYKCNKWWFEMVDIYRRIAFIALLPLISSFQSSIRASLGCFLAVISVCFYREQQPFLSDFTNQLSYYAQVVIFEVYYFALTINTNSTIDFMLSGWKLGVFLTATHGLLLVMVCFHTFKTTKLRREELRNKEFVATHYENALGFTETKFRTIFEALWRNDIPSTHTLAFHYTSLRSAKQASKSGIPTNLTYEGVAITLRPPHKTTRGDFEVFGDPEKKKFPPRNKYTKQSSTDTSDIYMNQKNGGRREFPHEHVLVLSLPKRFLSTLPGYEEDEALRLIPADVLNALRPSSFDNVYDPQPWLDKKTLLSPTCIVRSYWIFDKTSDMNAESEGQSGMGRTFIRAVSSFRLSSSPSFISSEKESNNANNGEGGGGDEEEDAKLKLALKDKAFKHKIDSVTKIELVSEYISDMKFIRSQAARSSLVPFYHYTSRSIAPLIIERGLRCSYNNNGNIGLKDGVFVSTLGPASYGIGTEEYEMNIIKDCFGVTASEKLLAEVAGKGKFDVVIVYGCAPLVFEQSPEGRDNARFVPRSTFEAFSLKHPLCGSYYLRPDRILEVFEVDTMNRIKHTLPFLDRDSVQGCEEERQKDQVVIEKLYDYQAKLRQNELGVNKALLMWWHTPFGGSHNLVPSPPAATSLEELEAEVALSTGRDMRESIEFESSSIKSPSKSSMTQPLQAKKSNKATNQSVKSIKHNEMEKVSKSMFSFSLFGNTKKAKSVSIKEESVELKQKKQQNNLEKQQQKDSNVSDGGGGGGGGRGSSTGRVNGRSLSKGRSRSSPRDVVIPSPTAPEDFGDYAHIEDSSPPSKLTLVPCPSCGRTFAPATAERHIPRCKGATPSISRNSSLGRASTTSLGRASSSLNRSSSLSSPQADKKKKATSMATHPSSPTSPTTNSKASAFRRATSSTKTPKSPASPNNNSTLLGTAL